MSFHHFTLAHLFGPKAGKLGGAMLNHWPHTIFPGNRHSIGSGRKYVTVNAVVAAGRSGSQASGELGSRTGHAP
ncbi:hypothetical protein BN77_p10804 [Rhizobium mesoamericanum STM3625]|uniref:Uncharacterized protein n=1 Tax=Rhizobium mesoamericanum STM3625 TaxID=1211777 RepID=K0PS07_9HYPH|nr:hypothetical protein BN77_p10804 [Rhizobium mesoamericanum STM3625]